MFRKTLKIKWFLIALTFLGVFALGVCQVQATAHNMDNMDCARQVLCAPCTVPMASESPKIEIPLTMDYAFSDGKIEFPEPHTVPLYHPPR